MSGLQIGRVGRGAVLGGAKNEANAAKADLEPSGPDAAHLKAQDRFLREGKKLSDPEKFKREQHPFDAYERLKEQARNNTPPTPPDNFRWRYYGLFYVAPTQNSFMRSLVPDIFHSPSRKSCTASLLNSSSCGPSTTRTGPSDRAGIVMARSADTDAVATGISSLDCKARG